MSTQDKTSSRLPKSFKDHQRVPTWRPGSFLHRLDLRFPWLKLVCVLCIGIIAIIDLCDLTISKIGESYGVASIAPMSRHVRVTKRNLEGKKLVALTFDDGPSSETTPSLLDILYREDVLATFFVLGNRTRSNPDIVKRAASEGHQIASHTMYHQNLIRLSPADVQSDIDEANAVFNSVLGHNPELTRPPYGNINDTVRSAANTPLILWSVDTLDWKSKDPATILATAAEQVHDGAIILMHDIHPTTVEAVPTLITSLRDAGYEFVTISELTKIRGVNLENGVAYRNFTP